MSTQQEITFAFGYVVDMGNEAKGGAIKAGDGLCAVKPLKVRELPDACRDTAGFPLKYIYFRRHSLNAFCSIFEMTLHLDKN